MGLAKFGQRDGFHAFARGESVWEVTHLHVIRSRFDGGSDSAREAKQNGGPAEVGNLGIPQKRFEPAAWPRGSAAYELRPAGSRTDSEGEAQSAKRG